MPLAKLSASGAPNAMKSDDGNDSLDTYIQQAIGKEPLLSFSRTGDSPVQWIQLLHALDQPDLPGWPLLTPLKIQLQKCEKCSMEFCSLINYRRHIRMHRRSLKIDKESHKIRDLLGAFWDKLSFEAAKKVVSFDDVSLKELSGSSVVKALASSLRKPGVWTLPQVYVKAGSILLEIVQAKASRFPISSQELFSILDDASERTFLCAGTAESVQKFVIDGEAEKALDLKNLVASASLLFEQKLVRAWLADKDAEALRCQKLLVEEEEAAQKRQAQLLERKKLKKLRQKEQKAREQSNSEKADSNADSVISSADSIDVSLSAEISIPQVPFDNISDTLADLDSCLEQIQICSNKNDESFEVPVDLNDDYIDADSIHNVGARVELANSHRQYTINRWQVPKSHRSGRNGFHGSQNLQAVKLEDRQKPGPLKERSAVANGGLESMPKQGPLKERSTVANGGRVWTRKSKLVTNDESFRTCLKKVSTDHLDKSNCELLIGSISVPVRKSSAEQHDTRGPPTFSNGEYVICEKVDITGKILDSDAVQNGAVMRKPVCQSETRGDLPVQTGNQDSEEAATVEKVEDQAVSSETCLQSCAADLDDSKCERSSSERNEQPEELPFSSFAAKAFLAQRWKEAISADHVKLVLSPEPPGHPDGREECSVIVPSSGTQERSGLGDAENRQAGVGSHVSVTIGNAKAKYRIKPEKGATKIKYIPKQKVVS